MRERAAERMGRAKEYIARDHPRLRAFGEDVRKHVGRAGRFAAKAGIYAASQIPGMLVSGTAAGLGAYYGAAAPSAPPYYPPTHVAPTQPTYVAPTQPTYVAPTQPAYVAPT